MYYLGVPRGRKRKLAAGWVERNGRLISPWRQKWHAEIARRCYIAVDIIDHPDHYDHCRFLTLQQTRLAEAWLAVREQEGITLSEKYRQAGLMAGYGAKSKTEFNRLVAARVAASVTLREYYVQQYIKELEHGKESRR